MAYKFNTENIPVSGPPIAGEMAIVMVPVRVIFEWSDRIIDDADYDDNGNVIESSIEYKSGFIMIPLPNQRIVYNNEQKITIAQTFKEK